MVCDVYHSKLLMLQFPKINFVVTVPTNVNNLRCNTSSSTQVNISWEHPTQTNGVIRFYEVILNNINTTLNTTKYVESDTTTIIINHLHPNHHYLCSVAVYSAVGRNISSTQYVMLRQSSKRLTGVLVCLVFTINHAYNMHISMLQDYMFSSF